MYFNHVNDGLLKEVTDVYLILLKANLLESVTKVIALVEHIR